MLGVSDDVILYIKNVIYQIRQTSFLRWVWVFSFAFKVSLPFLFNFVFVRPSVIWFMHFRECWHRLEASALRCRRKRQNGEYSQIYIQIPYFSLFDCPIVLCWAVWMGHHPSCCIPAFLWHAHIHPIRAKHCALEYRYILHVRTSPLINYHATDRPLLTYGDANNWSDRPNELVHGFSNSYYCTLCFSLQCRCWYPQITNKYIPN